MVVVTTVDSWRVWVGEHALSASVSLHGSTRTPWASTGHFSVAGTILAWGLVVAICIAAVACTVAVVKETHRHSRYMPDVLEALLIVVVGALTFAGGWLLVSLYWLGLHGLRFMRRGDRLVLK